MAWCPKCKRDYFDEVTECKECNISLFEGESKEYELLINDSNEEVVYTIYNYLNDTTNYSVHLYENEEAGTYEIYALLDELENIKLVLTTFLEDELKSSDETLEEILDNIATEERPNNSSATYVSAKDKYEERRSSAFSMLFVGTLGMIYMILNLLGFGFIKFEGSADLLFNITMFLIFGIFIIVGVATYLNSKRMKYTISEEEDLIENLKAFFNEKITAEGIDNECNFTDETEELKYFSRQSLIKDKLFSEYPEADETLVDQLIDEYYPMIFK